MTITDLISLGVNTTATAPSASVGASGSSQRSTQSSALSDNVSLSGLAQLLQTGSSDRAARLASLSAAVRSGTYNVSPEALSRSVVSETISASQQFASQQ
jgi:anti-sigma28 factor (negative regulator of flagellin synthesis)